MGLLFADKIVSLLELHPPQSWITRDDVYARIKAGPLEGFFTIDAVTNKTEVISRDAITSALRDAKWWKLIELEPTRSKLSGPAGELKSGKTIVRDDLGNVLADVLHGYTKGWVGKDKALDVAEFVALVQTVAKDGVPSTHYLWNHMSKASPEIFNEDNLKPRRFRQLLAMLGSRGAGRLQEVRTQLHFVNNDPRLKEIQAKER